MIRVLVLYYSEKGHVEQLAMAVAHGARSVPEAEVLIKRVPSLMPEEGGNAAIPVASPLELAEYDAILFGTPTRFGNMCAEMRHFLDQTGPLWVASALQGRVGAVFVSTSTQHGGHETTITSFHNTLLHHGMIIVGLPPSELGLMNMAEITGGSPYGAGTISANDDMRQPNDNELDLAEALGRRVAKIASLIYAQVAPPQE